MLCSLAFRAVSVALAALLPLFTSALAQNRPTERQALEVTELRIRGTHAIV